MDGEDVLVADGVDAPGPPVRTLDRTVQGGDEVRPDPGAGLGGRVAVELDQLGVTERTALAAAPVEDQLHRAIVARITPWAWDRTVRHNQRHDRHEHHPIPYRPAAVAGRAGRPGQLDTAGTGFSGKKADAAKATEALAPELGDLQERLYAAGRVPNAPDRKILVILQGMDTSGKGGVIRHAIGMVDPQGIKIKAFGPPPRRSGATRTSGGSSARCRRRA